MHARATRANARKIVAHTPTAAHGLGRLTQRLINTGVTVLVAALNAVAHRLHEAIDERGLDARARRAHDASGTNGASSQMLAKTRCPQGALLGCLGVGYGARHAVEQIVHALLAGFEVFFAQHVQTDRLRGQRGQGVGR